MMKRGEGTGKSGSDIKGKVRLLEGSEAKKHVIAEWFLTHLPIQRDADLL